MVEFKLTNGYSPMLFSVNGYQVVVMPMLTDYANEQQKADREAKGKAEPTEPEVTEPVTKPKPKKRNRKKVAVTT